MTVIELEPFRAEHLQGVVALCAAEGWDTYTEDPERTRRALSSPGSTTLIAVDGGVVAGLIQLQSDGEIQAHLSALLVGEAWRATATIFCSSVPRAGGAATVAAGC